jgi:hypothetical protein
MKTTRRASFPAKSARVTVRPVRGSGRAKPGAGVPSGVGADDAAICVLLDRFEDCTETEAIRISL